MGWRAGKETSIIREDFVEKGLRLIQSEGRGRGVKGRW